MQILSRFQLASVYLPWGCAVTFSINSRLIFREEKIQKRETSKRGKYWRETELKKKKIEKICNSFLW